MNPPVQAQNTYAGIALGFGKPAKMQVGTASVASFGRDGCGRQFGLELAFELGVVVATKPPNRGGRRFMSIAVKPTGLSAGSKRPKLSDPASFEIQKERDATTRLKTTLTRAFP